MLINRYFNNESDNKLKNREIQSKAIDVEIGKAQKRKNFYESSIAKKSDGEKAVK